MSGEREQARRLSPCHDLKGYRNPKLAFQRRAGGIPNDKLRS